MSVRIVVRISLLTPRDTIRPHLTGSKPLSLRDEIAAADEHERWLTARMRAANIPTHPRHQMMGGLFFQVQENASAVRILLSVQHPHYGSAAALLRPIFEMFVRALWVRDCANEQQFEHVTNPENDDFVWPVLMKEMTIAVDQRGGFNGLLTGIQQGKVWKAMCSYSHGGLRLIARRNSAEAIESTATEEEMIEVMRFAVLMSLFATSIWCEIAGDAEGAKEASARAKPYLVKPAAAKPEPSVSQ
jgi:hypothetical protein